jgi:hypothetical protein
MLVLSRRDCDRAIAAQNELLPTLGAVQEYIKPALGPSSGTRNLDEDRANPSSAFGRVGFGLLDGMWVVILEAVGDDGVLATHAAALSVRVPEPDRVVVCRTAISEARFREINDLLTSRLIVDGRFDERFHGLDRMNDGRVRVNLTVGAVQLAQSLTGEFGGDIAITLGHLLWPSQRLPDGLSPYYCRSNISRSRNTSLRWKVRSRVSVRQNTVGSISVKATNKSRSSVDTPRVISLVTRVGSRLPIATDSRNLVYLDEANEFPRGKSLSLSVEVFTDSCDPNLGYSLPAGKYHLFLVDVAARPEAQSVVGPIPLTITK